MKKTLPLIFLVACSTLKPIEYRGESATYAGDNILRNDVTTTITNFEKTQSNCKDINIIDASIENLEQINGAFRIQERWRVTACNATKNYRVIMEELPNNGTNYYVGLEN